MGSPVIRCRLASIARRGAIVEDDPRYHEVRSKRSDHESVRSRMFCDEKRRSRGAIPTAVKWCSGELRVYRPLPASGAATLCGARARTAKPFVGRADGILTVAPLNTNYRVARDGLVDQLPNGGHLRRAARGVTGKKGIGRCKRYFRISPWSIASTPEDAR